MPRNVSLANFPRGVRSSPESCELRLRPPVPSPARPFRRRTAPLQDPAGLPLVRFLLPRTQLRQGAPFSDARFLAVAHVGRGSPDPRRCRPQGSCPSRRFRLTRGSLEVFWTPPIAVVPCASRPCFMPLASLELPSRAFPSRGAVPTLVGRCFLAGSLSDCRRRRACGVFTTAFTGSRRLFAARAHPKADPGLMRRDDGFLRSLGRSPQHT